MPTPPIPSPYNFVPLSKHVFFPDWAAQVSQDVPFLDGISGWFDVEVEATTPIYIRGGGRIPKPKDSDRERWVTDDEYLSETKEFARLYRGGPFAIPGTSLKGMLRAALEAICFGKFRDVDANPYSVRDLNTPDKSLYLDHLTDTNAAGHFVALSRPGFLRRGPDGSLEVRRCDCARVEQTDLEAFATKQLGARAINLGRKQRAEEKYEAWGRKLFLDFLPGPPPPHWSSRGLPLDFEMAGQLVCGTRAQVVFTGQPANRQPRDTKHREFLFYGKQSKGIPVVEEVQEQFEFIHSDGGVGVNKDFAFLKKWFWDCGEDIPVFYLEDGGLITAIGLAQMFRLPCPFTLRDLARHQQALAGDPRPDLAETLFGSAAGDAELRGRIHLEPLPVLSGTDHQLEVVTTVLNAPKPTFYPNYLEQPITDHETGKITGKYATLMQKDLHGSPAARLRGWKQFRARADRTPTEQRPALHRNDDSVNYASLTSFRPLNFGARFRGRIHVHNLRPTELGALLWLLTWGERDTLRHRLGMGKPLGYGNVRIHLCPESSLDLASGGGQSILLDDFPRLLKDFEGVMNQWCRRRFGLDWAQRPQFKAALALADPATPWPNAPHHPLEVRDFAAYKRLRIGQTPDRRPIYASYALLPIPGVGFPGAEPPVPDAPPAGPVSRPPHSDPSPQPLPDLTGRKVEARLKTRDGAEAVFKFQADDRELTGMPIPDLRPRFRKSLASGRVYCFLVTGLPDAAGRYPLGPT